MHDSHTAARRECPSCGTLVTLPGTGSCKQRFQCPKCLAIVDRNEEPTAADTAVTSRGNGDRRTVNEPEAVAEALPAGQDVNGNNGAGSAELGRLRAERDDLAMRLRQAEEALRQAGTVIARIAELEERTGELGKRCVENATRLLELEIENARLRQKPD